jgi:hypothetical protein
MIEKRPLELKAELDRLYPGGEIHLLNLNDLAPGLPDRDGVMFDALLPKINEHMWKWDEFVALFERRQISLNKPAGA